MERCLRLPIQTNKESQSVKFVWTWKERPGENEWARGFEDRAQVVRWSNVSQEQSETHNGPSNGATVQASESWKLAVNSSWRFPIVASDFQSDSVHLEGRAHCLLRRESVGIPSPHAGPMEEATIPLACQWPLLPKGVSALEFTRGRDGYFGVNRRGREGVRWREWNLWRRIRIVVFTGGHVRTPDLHVKVEDTTLGCR